MVEITDEQKQIAVLLMHEAKSAEELHKQLGIQYDRLNESLKEMLRLKLISKGGFPTKYTLNKEITSAVLKRKEISQHDKFKLRLRIVIEAQSVEKELLEKQLKKIEEAMRKEEIFTIYDCQLAKMVKHDENYTSFLEVDLSVKDFRSAVRLLFFYGPVSVEVVKPAKFDIAADDLQEGFMDMAEMIQGYNNYLIKLMKRDEIEQLHRKIFGQN